MPCSGGHDNNDLMFEHVSSSHHTADRSGFIGAGRLAAGLAWAWAERDSTIEAVASGSRTQLLGRRIEVTGGDAYSSIEGVQEPGS